MVVASLADARWTESWWPSRDIAVAFVGASLATPVGYCRSRRPAKHGGRRQATPLRAPLVHNPTERIARRTESLAEPSLAGRAEFNRPRLASLRARAHHPARA